MQPRTLVVVPTFNERRNIEPLLAQLLALPLAPDVLVVDDASPDGTAAAVRGVVDRYPGRLHLLVRREKAGRGGAVLAGFAWALQRPYEAVCEMDADLSHDPRALPGLVAALSDADVVIGSRYVPGGRIADWGMRRRLFSRIANAYARRMLGIPIKDYTTGYRAYRREALERLEMDRIDARGYVVLSAVAYQLHLKGMRFAEVPIVFRDRRQGSSNFSLAEVREAFRSTTRLRHAWSTSPARGDGRLGTGGK